MVLQAGLSRTARPRSKKQVDSGEHKVLVVFLVGAEPVNYPSSVDLLYSSWSHTRLIRPPDASLKRASSTCSISSCQTQSLLFAVQKVARIANNRSELLLLIAFSNEYQWIVSC